MTDGHSVDPDILRDSKEPPLESQPLGQPEFAIDTAMALLAEHYENVAIVVQLPDEPWEARAHGNNYAILKIMEEATAQFSTTDQWDWDDDEEEDEDEDEL